MDQALLGLSPNTATDLAGRLRRYLKLSEFKRAALMASVRHLGAYEHEQLRALFQRVATGNLASQDFVMFLCKFRI